MNPQQFLEEECRSVAAALNATLRHDYGPERSRTYFEECKVRLASVEQALKDDAVIDRDVIAENMRKLSSLGSRISFIERAHLGEFSWPFAGIIEQVADQLFVEESRDEKMEPVQLTPIVHVVAEGTDYQIVDDEMPPPGDRRIIIVAFPRQLKHHVLLHAIFGHELCHTALRAEKPGKQMKIHVLPKACRGPLQDRIQAHAWLRRDDAPAAIKAAVARDGALTLDDQSLVNWRQEIICDLFGLRLFGPAFAAAHRTIIEALCPSEDHFDIESTTHPSYPIRQRILATAVEILGWNQPVSTDKDGSVYEGETQLLAYLTQTCGPAWFTIFERAELEELLEGIETVLKPYGLAYQQPTPETLCELVCRIAQERPPIFQSVDDTGDPNNRDVAGAHCLYAGWIYWFGKGPLAADAKKSDSDVLELSFLELNRLCDQALLQQRAISLMKEPF